VERAIDRFASILAQGYGLTEACGAVTWLGTELHAVFDPKIQRSSGTLLPEMTSQVVRLDGTMASGAEPGELWLKGVKVALGEGGWLRTGDLGYFDEHQRWVIVDRLKDIIISGGENVASREVEAVLQLHSDVVEVAVVGVPSPVWGEAVAAFVVLREGVPGDEAHATALIQFAKNQLAGFKAPKHIVWCRDLPRTVAGKIDKKLLRAQPNPDATVLNDH
jgi:acyl-CoA synthetase (AMP-forming)/AMP-acid ligase II